MTISSTSNRVSYNGNGATTAFAVSFPFHAQADLVVLSTVIATGVQTTKSLTTHYTISGTTDSLGHYSSGGTVNFLTAPASTERITIYRDPARTQGLDLQDASSFPAESIEAQLDYVTMLLQRVSDLIVRSARQPDGDASNIGTLPSSVDRASKFLAFDSNSNPIAAAGTSANLGPVSAFINTLLDDVDAATARTTLGAASAATLTDDEAILTSLKQAIRNPIVNGNMEVWQRGTSFITVIAQAYMADRWYYELFNLGAGLNINRSTNVPTVGQAGVLFNYSFEVDVTGADVAVGADNSHSIRHRIEGFNWRQFAQRQLTVQFWVMSTKTGIHSFAIRNSGTDRYYIAEYTVNVADTWEQKTITIPASPSAGTWNYTTGIGAELIWTLMAGTNYHGTVGAWSTGAAYASASQVNVMDNTANFFRLTGVKMELGSIATPVQFVPFEEELARCLRYYQKSFPYATAPAQNAGTTGSVMLNAPFTGTTLTSVNVAFQNRMRAQPTIVTYNPSAANSLVRNVTDAADSTAIFTTTTEWGVTIQFNPNAANTVSDQHNVHWAVDAEL